MRTRTEAPPDWCRVEEIAAGLGISVKTARRRIADGTIPARRVGGILLISRDLLTEPGEPANAGAA